MCRKLLGHRLKAVGGNPPPRTLPFPTPPPQPPQLPSLPPGMTVQSAPALQESEENDDFASLLAGLNVEPSTAGSTAGAWFPQYSRDSIYLTKFRGSYHY